MVGQFYCLLEVCVPECHIPGTGFFSKNLGNFPFRAFGKRMFPVPTQYRHTGDIVSGSICMFNLIQPQLSCRHTLIPQPGKCSAREPIGWNLNDCCISVFDFSRKSKHPMTSIICFFGLLLSCGLSAHSTLSGLRFTKLLYHIIVIIVLFTYDLHSTLSPFYIYQLYMLYRSLDHTKHIDNVCPFS